MTTKTWKLGWQRLFLILAVLPCCSSLEVSIPQQEYEAASGSDVELTCSFVPARPVTNILVLSWEASPDQAGESLKPVATFYLSNPVDIAPDYEGRASLQVDMDRQVATLRLTKVTIQDSRSYQCSVMIPGDADGTTAASTSLLVLVAPSPPICAVQGTAEYFHNINLTCKSEEGSPPPAYEWTTYTVANAPRQFPPKTTQKNGVLSLFNVTRETSGFFICTSTNRIGSASCNFTLAVMPPSMNIASTAGIIGGVLAGVVVLGILLFCCCRKKGQKDKNAESNPEQVFYDKDGPEVGEAYQDDKSGSEIKQTMKYEETTVPQSYLSVGPTGKMLEDDQQSYNSGKDRHDGKGSDVDSRRYREEPRDHHRGSRDHLDDKRDRYGGSREHLDDKRDRYGGSREHLDDRRERSSGSRDRLDDHRERYGGSRDRLEDNRERYGGSRDRLDDQRERYGGSRDRLDDQRERYGGSRDRLDDRRDRYGGSRDRLDDHGDRYRGSRDHIEYADDY